MPDPRETLARIRAQADAATEGPWEIDLDGDIQGRRKGCRPDPEMDPMVGTLDRPEDTAFTAASRTTVPALADALEKVLNLHFKAQPIPAAYGTQEGGDYCVTCAKDWPCPTVTAITTALEATK